MIYMRQTTDANTCLGVAQIPEIFSTLEQVFASVVCRMYIIWKAEILTVETTSHLEQIWTRVLENIIYPHSYNMFC